MSEAPSGVKRFDWEEMRRYWSTYASRFGDVDWERDPDGLLNVCEPLEPLSVNHYLARHQRLVFEELLSLVPPTPDGKALDVGCGAGRWSRLLAEHGYAVTGIDLQEPLLRANRRRDPHIEYEYVAVQDYAPAARFDVISSVTVIQHVPFAEQQRVLEKIAQLLRPGGHVIALENVRVQAPHMFSNDVGGWRRRFEDAGLEIAVARRYDYSPALRAYFAGLHGSIALRHALKGRRFGGPRLRPEQWMEGSERPTRTARLAERAGRGARDLALWLDGRVEPTLIRRRVPFPTRHRGFLLRHAS